MKFLGKQGFESRWFARESSWAQPRKGVKEAELGDGGVELLRTQNVSAGPMGCPRAGMPLHRRISVVPGWSKVAFAWPHQSLSKAAPFDWGKFLVRGLSWPRSGERATLEEVGMKDLASAPGRRMGGIPFHFSLVRYHFVCEVTHEIRLTSGFKSWEHWNTKMAIIYGWNILLSFFTLSLFTLFTSFLYNSVTICMVLSPQNLHWLPDSIFCSCL